MITPKILLHICCAPCSLPVIKHLQKKGFLITGFWYNPNIWPKEEYEKRKEALSQYEKEKDLSIIYDDSWAPRLAPVHLDKRCPCCYEDRLTKTAEVAQSLNFDFFTTTLLVSPYQKHTIIRDLAEDISQEFGVNFFYEDFRPLFSLCKKERQDFNLYHQRYCGCKPSMKEAEGTRKRQKAKKT